MGAINKAISPAKGKMESMMPIWLLLRPKVFRKRIKTDPKKVNWTKTELKESPAMLQGSPFIFWMVVGSFGEMVDADITFSLDEQVLLRIDYSTSLQVEEGQ